jgi:hypothetical protein
MKKPFIVRNKQNGHMYTFVCVHDPKSERYTFSNVARPFEKLNSVDYMETNFNLV